MLYDIVYMLQSMCKGLTGPIDADIIRLRQKLGELTMDNELLQQKIERLEAGRPLPWRRSRR
jgi:hypothetical protein